MVSSPELPVESAPAPSLKSPPIERDFTLFHTLHTLYSQDSNLYWTRFSAFATVHAAALVVSTSTGVEASRAASVVIGVLGFALAALWFVIQYISLARVERWQDAYHAEQDRLKLSPAEARFKKVSSTKISTYAAPLGVAVIWIVLLGIAATPLFQPHTVTVTTTPPSSAQQ